MRKIAESKWSCYYEEKSNSHGIAAPGLVCQVALASDAAKLTLPSGMNNPMTLRYPELANAPAPTLVEEGLRATYEEYTGSGSEETTERGTYVSGESPGVGLVQVDVVALEGGKAATWTSTYAPDPTNGAMKTINTYGSVNPVGCGDFWCNPPFFAAFRIMQARIWS